MNNASAQRDRADALPNADDVVYCECGQRRPCNEDCARCQEPPTVVRVGFDNFPIPALQAAQMALVDKRPVTLKDAVEAAEAAQLLADIREATGLGDIL